MPEVTGPRIFSEAPLPLGLGDRFVDRSGPLEHLRRGLVAPNPSAIALTAAGGLGKTRLALELVWRHGGRFPGGVFWLEVSAPARREAGLYALLRLLRPDTPALAQLQAQGVAVAAALAGAARAHAGGHAQLWVLDHVPEAEGEDVGPGMAELCPRWGEVAVLLTSRMRPDDAALEVVELEALDEAAGAALLTAGLPPGSMRGEDAATVVRWVGGLPVALELLARSLDLGDLSPDELLAQTRGEGVTRALGETQQALRRAGMASGLVPIVDSLRISYERLAPEVQALARCVAQFGPEPLPTALIKALGPVASRLARATLAARSFVTGISGEMFGAMHRVLADFLRGLCGPGEPAAACAALLAAMPAADCQNPARWPALTRLAPHAEALLIRGTPEVAGIVELGLRLAHFYHFQQRGLEGERVLRRTLELAAPLPATHRNRLTAAGNLAYILVTLGQLAEARALATPTLALCEQALGPDDELTLALRNNLALALQALGELQAAHDELTRLAAQLERVHGPDSAEVFNAWTSLATTKQVLGDLAGARALQERTLAGWRRAGPDEPGGLLVAAGLAQTLQLQGDLAGAHARISAALAIGLRVWGPDHLSTLLLRETLAGVLRDAGDLAGARAQYETVLAGQRRVTGPLHPRTLTTQANLANTLALQGDSAAARALQEDALALGRPRLGLRHPVLLRTLLGLAETLQTQGELARCRELLEDGLLELRATGGPASPEVLQLEQRLADVLGQLGQFDAARALQTRVLAAWEAQVGPRHALTLAAAATLALIDTRRGAFDEAEALQTRVLADSRALLGRDHPETLLRARHLAATLFARGELARAEALQHEAIAGLLRSGAADDPALLVAQVELSSTLQELGRLAEAEVMLLPALAGLRARLPADHGVLLDARASEARLRLRQGRLDEARALLTGLLPALQARHGPASVPVAFMVSTLAWTLFEAGDAAGAAPLFAAALATFERVLPDDANTVATALNLAVALVRSGGERDGARAVLERARLRVREVAGPDSPLLATIAEYAVKLGLAPA